MGKKTLLQKRAIFARKRGTSALARKTSALALFTMPPSDRCKGLERNEK